MTASCASSAVKQETSCLKISVVIIPIVSRQRCKATARFALEKSLQGVADVSRKNRQFV